MLVQSHYTEVETEDFMVCGKLWNTDSNHYNCVTHFLWSARLTSSTHCSTCAVHDSSMRPWGSLLCLPVWPLVSQDKKSMGLNVAIWHNAVVFRSPHGKQPIHSLNWDTCTHDIPILSITVCAIVKLNFSLALLSFSQILEYHFASAPCVVGLCPYIYVCDCDRVTPQHLFVCLLPALCLFVCVCLCVVCREHLCCYVCVWFCPSSTIQSLNLLLKVTASR